MLRRPLPASPLRPPSPARRRCFWPSTSPAPSTPATTRCRPQGLADALSDPEVAEALVAGQIALAVVQWSGTGAQALVLPWQRMLDRRRRRPLRRPRRRLPRAFTGSDTAVGDRPSASATAQFAAVPDCRRRSSTSPATGRKTRASPTPAPGRQAHDSGRRDQRHRHRGPGPATPITTYYRRWIITPGGFVVTARGLQDYRRNPAPEAPARTDKPVG